MNYSQTLAYLQSRLPMFQRIGAAAYKADLGNTIALCRILGDPQKKIKAVHIAGTNGKGSVSHMLASILQESGLKTGLFTSPHMKDFRERIRIDGKKISKGRVTGFVSKYRKVFDNIQPSFFEMTAGLAFRYFAEEKTDIAVIETGLGGRLDSTNVVNPVLCIITNIGYDHMEFLGDTLEKIAWEKAGIIKPGIPLIIGESQPETMPVFDEKAASVKAPILYADLHCNAGDMPGGPPSFRRIEITGESPWLPLVIDSPLTGNYQLRNIVTVVAAALKLQDLGFRISPAAIARGINKVISNTGLLGRWQILGTQPLTICDTGHNEDGLRYVLEQIGQTRHKTLHFVFGMVSDKAIEKILDMLPRDAVYYFCKADIPRGKDASELRSEAENYGLRGSAYPSVREALEAARITAGPDDLVFIGGSTFVVAEVV